jgi:LmbE family N-acetylglucosaminyl deacetylase
MTRKPAEARWIYISPHLDDAVLSCGGLIYEQVQSGLPVSLWTICAGTPPPGELSPLAQVCHFQWGTVGASETVTLRIGEDRSAAALLGAQSDYFSIPDCIYRRGPQGDLLYTEDVFVPRHPAEADLDRQITAALAQELRPNDTLVCPLSIGAHVDHVLVRAAVEALHRPLLYYADIPYVLKEPNALETAATGMTARLHPVGAAGLERWQAGIAAYASQMKVLFESEARMRAAILAYWEVSRGIRLWAPPG